MEALAAAIAAIREEERLQFGYSEKVRAAVASISGAAAEASGSGARDRRGRSGPRDGRRRPSRPRREGERAYRCACSGARDPKN